MNISAAESVVMEVLWRKHPQSAEDIVTALQGKQTWEAPTVRTLLNRLLKKGAITAAKEGRYYLYRPLIERDEYLFTESSGMIDRLFAGRVAPLVAQFSGHRKLSKKDLDELKHLIEEMYRGR